VKLSGTKSTFSGGKWLGIAVLGAGVIAALAEWKFRPRDDYPPVTPATAPASPEW